MVVVEVVVDIPQLLVLAVRVAVVLVVIVVLELLELLIQAVAVVVLLLEQAVPVVLVLSLFDTPTRLQQQPRPQVHPQSRLLVATVSINGLDQGVSHSDGTLCKTQF
jgi:hypothetical protein